MQQVVDATERFGRKIAFVGYSMKQNSKMAKKLGYLNIPRDLEVGLDEALNMKPKDVVLMATGSQGEPYSIMGRLSRGTNRRFDLIKNDTIVLSSHAIPGNEEAVYKTINRLFRRGANVVYEPLAEVHVSGHAKQDEMKLMLNIVNPQHLIPIHGELRHLKHHAVLAKEAGFPEEKIAVIENGQVIEFENGELTGTGTMVSPDGQKYTGGFRRGIPEGEGTLTYPDGTLYKGQFRNGLPNGEGTMIFPSGQKYIASFKDGLPHGRGYMISKGGRRYKGHFANGRFVGRTLRDD
jgi:mRNA degradation ribonuclease J1/J2